MIFVASGFRDFLEFNGLNRKAKNSSNRVQVSSEATNIHKPAVDTGNRFHNQSNSASVKRGRIPSWHSFDSRLQLAVILSALFVILTMSIAILFFIDLSGADFSFEAGRALSQTLVHLYTLLCPVMMAHYMPNLRMALSRFCTKILFCFS